MDYAVVDKEKLVAALELAAKNASTRSTLTATKCVKIEADGDLLLRIHGTNLETSLRVTLPCCGGEGKFSRTAAVDKLLKVVKLAKGETVKLAPGDGETALTCGLTTLTGGVLDADYPVWPEKEKGEVGIAKVNALVLADAIRRVRPFISEGVVRYALNGVFIESRKGRGKERNGIYVIGCDGKRIGIQEVEGEFKHTGKLIIPPEASYLIAKAARANADASLCLYIAEYQKDEKGKLKKEDEGEKFRVTVGDIEIYGRAVEGHYPNWPDVVPDYDGGYVVSREDFADALEQVEPCVSERARAVKLTFDDKLTVFAKAADVGESEVVISATANASSKPFEVVMDHFMLKEYLKTLQADSVVKVQGKEKMGAVLFTSEAAKGYEYVQMPLSIQV